MLIYYTILVARDLKKLFDPPNTAEKKSWRIRAKALAIQTLKYIVLLVLEWGEEICYFCVGGIKSVFLFYFCNFYLFNNGRVVPQKRQVIIAPLGSCYRHILQPRFQLLEFLESVRKDGGG